MERQLLLLCLPLALVAGHCEWSRLTTHLEKIYGVDKTADVLPRLQEIVDKWTVPIAEELRRNSRVGTLTEKDVVMIAYGDHIHSGAEAPLATLANWARKHVKGLVSTIHLLPFHPSTSYEGYSITDYMAVDYTLGTWSNVEEVERDFALMFDVVLNHCSASHPWFLEFLADEEPGRRYFISVDDPSAPWLRNVYRARTSPLLTRFLSTNGTERHVWTTYDPDLVDLNWAEPDMFAEFADMILEYAARGARMLRLDAFVYTWKRMGTTCINQPETHHLLRAFRDVLALAGASTAILPSITNVDNDRNFEYLGTAAEGDHGADLIYNLPLSSVLLHTLYSRNVTAISEWLRRLPNAPPGRAFLNLAATHDGIGLSWLRDKVTAAEYEGFIAKAQEHGALLSKRRRTVVDPEEPWELNAAYFHACSADVGEDLGGGGAAARGRAHVARFLATQSVVLALRGVPAIYFSLFLAGRNDYDRVRRTGDNRAINRGRFDLASWEARVNASDEQNDVEGLSVEARVLVGLQSLLRARRKCPAFHPEAGQRILDTGHASVFGLLRHSVPDVNTPDECGMWRGPEGGDGAAPGAGGALPCQRVVALTSVASESASVALGVVLEALGVSQGAMLVDMISGVDVASDASTLVLAPYQVLWVTSK